MISSSYSRRFAGVSGMMVTVPGAVTWKKLPVLVATAASAASNVIRRRSPENGVSRNCASKRMLTPPSSPSAEKTARALSLPKTTESGRTRSRGRSNPGGPASSVRSMSASSAVRPSGAAASSARMASRISRNARSMSAWPGFRSYAIWYSASASAHRASRSSRLPSA